MTKLAKSVEKKDEWNWYKDGMRKKDKNKMTHWEEREDDGWMRDGAVEPGCYVSSAAVRFPLLQLCTVEDSLLKWRPVELLTVWAASIRDAAV